MRYDSKINPESDEGQSLWKKGEACFLIIDAVDVEMLKEAIVETGYSVMPITVEQQINDSFSGKIERPRQLLPRSFFLSFRFMPY